MSPEELLAARRLEPFVPFRLHLADGRSFEVPHPEAVLVTKRMASVAVYLPGHVPGRSFPARAETISLTDIVRLEPRQPVLG